MFKKKSAKSAKPQEQLQPDYVKKVKAKLNNEKKVKIKYSEEDMVEIEDFWKARNPNATFLGESNGTGSTIPNQP